MGEREKRRGGREKERMSEKRDSDGGGEDVKRRQDGDRQGEEMGQSNVRVRKKRENSVQREKKRGEGAVMCREKERKMGRNVQREAESKGERE